MAFVRVHVVSMDHEGYCFVERHVALVVLLFVEHLGHHSVIRTKHADCFGAVVLFNLKAVSLRNPSDLKITDTALVLFREFLFSHLVGVLT